MLATLLHRQRLHLKQLHRMRVRIKCNASHRHCQGGSLTAQTARRTAGQMRCRRWQSNTSMHKIDPKWLRRVLFETNLKITSRNGLIIPLRGGKSVQFERGICRGRAGSSHKSAINCRSSLRNRKIAGTPALAERSDHPGSGDGRGLRFGQPRGARETGLRPKSLVSGCAPGGPGVRPESRGPAVPGVRRTMFSKRAACMDCLECVHVFALGT